MLAAMQWLQCAPWNSGFTPQRRKRHSLIAGCWLTGRRLWNYALALLLELNDFSAWDKKSKTRVDCCPLPWSYRWQKDDDDEWQAIPYSKVRRYREGGLCCPIPQHHREPRLSGESRIALNDFFAKKKIRIGKSCKAVQ